MSIAGQVLGAVKFLRARLKERTTWLSISFIVLYFSGHSYDTTNLETLYSHADNLLYILLGMVGFFIKDESPISKVDK